MLDVVIAVAGIGSLEAVHGIDFVQGLVPAAEQEVVPHPFIAGGLVAEFDDHREAVVHQGLRLLQGAAGAHDGVDGDLGDLRVDEFRHLPGADVLVFVIRLQPFGGAELIVFVTEMRQRIGQRGRRAIVPALKFAAQRIEAENAGQLGAIFAGLAADRRADQQQQHHYQWFHGFQPKGQSDISLIIHGLTAPNQTVSLRCVGHARPLRQDGARMRQT